MVTYKIALLAVLLVVTVTAKPEINDEKASQPYEFEYAVSAAATPHSGGSSHQGHSEARVGDHSIGNYFVDLPEQGSDTRVSYTTDLWGYHPVVAYSSKGPTWGSSAHFAYGDRAVAAISQPNNPANLPVSIDSAAKVAHYDVSETVHNIQAAGSPPIPGHLVHQLDKAQHNLAVLGSGKVGVAPLASAVPVAAHAAPLAHAAPVAHFAPVGHVAPVAPLRVAQALPVVTPAPFIAPVHRPAAAFAITEHQKRIQPIVVAEFNSNNHILADHVPVTPAPFVSTTAAPYIAPTPGPGFVSPAIHTGSFLASTVSPAPYRVNASPLFHKGFVSSTPQPFVSDFGAHIQPHPQTVVVDRPVPVEVTKVVEKPVHVPVEVTKYVDRPVEVTKYVDRPVEVTKFVDRPVEVTKYVDRPVPVTKYVDRPVEVIRHVPVEKPVYVPGPVVEKHVQVPVTKVVHVDRPVPQPVPVPYAVPQPVPHAIAKPVPVPYAQYVLNVPYGYGRRGNLFRGDTYKSAAYQTEAFLKPACGPCGRTESASIDGFKVSKAYLEGANYLPPQGPTKVTLTVEPHLHKTANGPRLCTDDHGGFKPPFIPSPSLPPSFDENW